MRILFYLIAPLCILSLSACVDPNYASRGGYNDPYYHDDYYSRREYDRARDERRALERERERLEDERERLDHERKKSSHASEVRQEAEHCPSGFTPSENKCSAEDRRHGCKDVRLKNGQGCVRR